MRKAVRTDKAACAKRSIMADPSRKGVWRTARSALGQTNSKAPTCQKVNGDARANPFQMAETMASHYEDKVVDLRSRRATNPKVDPILRLRGALDRRLPGRRDLEKMGLKPISQPKMRDILRKYGGGRALGGDSLDGHLIKTASRVLLPALTHLGNFSIKEETFLE